MSAIRIYDNQGKTADRYTVVYMDMDLEPSGLYQAVGMSAQPFHPMGFGQHTSAEPGMHLGKRIKLTDLPLDCQKLVLKDLDSRYNRANHTDYHLNVDELYQKYSSHAGASHPDPRLSRNEWKSAIEQDATGDSYWGWVCSEIESERCDLESDGLLDAGVSDPDDLDDAEVTYLTNACGEDIGHGHVELTQEDYAKVAFEQGPGVLLPYIVEINDKKYVSANLEIAYQDEFWGDDQNFMSQDEALEYCKTANGVLLGRIADGVAALPVGEVTVLPVDNGDPGRLTVRVVIPLDSLKDAQHTSQLLSDVFADLAQAPKVIDSARASDRQVSAP